MKLLFDLFPLLVFFGVFSVYDIFIATAAAIVASLIQVSWLKFAGRKIETMHWITLGAIVVLGGATILLKDDAFIRWKPTVVYWCFAAILFTTQFFGRKTAIEYVMGSQLELPPQKWRFMNLSFAFFTMAMGFLNLYVAFYYGTDLDPDVQLQHWVYFKVFGTLILTFVFIFLLMLFVSKDIKVKETQ